MTKRDASGLLHDSIHPSSGRLLKTAPIVPIGKDRSALIARLRRRAAYWRKRRNAATDPLWRQRAAGLAEGIDEAIAIIEGGSR